MKRFLPLAAFFAAVQLAAAGIVIVQEAEQTSGPAPGKTLLTITASGDRARVDVGKEMSSIVDSGTGTVISLLHAQKLAMQLPEGAIKAIKAKTSQKKAKPDLEATGKKETINGFHCEEYTGTIEGMKVAFWVTNEVQDQKEILDQLGKLSGSGDPFKAALQSGADFPGFPIRTIINTPGAGKSTITVVSIKNEDVPDSAFEVPAGYKTMDVPQMSNPGRGAPAIPVKPNGN